MSSITRGITLGTFDLLHYGHIRLLKRMKKFDTVYVGLNTDEFITRYKGKPPIQTYEERAASIQEVFPNYHIRPNAQENGSIRETLSRFDVDVIVIGSDWLRKDYLKQIGLTEKDLVDLDIYIEVYPYTEGISTTEIKRRITNA